MRSLIGIVLFTAVLMSCNASAGSYCENFMPTDYRRCQQALSDGSQRTFGNWHLSLAGQHTELQLYPFNPPGVIDVALIVKCKNKQPHAYLRAWDDLPLNGSIRVLSKNRVLWSGHWKSDRHHQFFIPQHYTLLSALSKPGTDTVKLELTAPGIAPGIRRQTYHTLQTERAVRSLNCATLR